LITENTKEKRKFGVSHYYPATDEEREFEQRVNEKVDQGKSHVQLLRVSHCFILVIP